MGKTGDADIDSPNSRQTRRIRATASSTCCSVFVSPRLKRRLPATTLLGNPIARGWGRVPSNRLRRPNRPSRPRPPCPTPAIEFGPPSRGRRYCWFAANDRRPRYARWRLGRPALTPPSKRSRSAVSRRPCSSCSASHSSRAVCMPTAKAIDSVPGRFPLAGGRRRAAGPRANRGG